MWDVPWLGRLRPLEGSPETAPNCEPRLTTGAGNPLSHLDRPPQEGADVRLRGAIEAIVGSRFTSGNSVEVLRNGNEIFPSMLEAIAAAERTIDFVTFVYWTGEIAERMAEALARSSRSGVRVRAVLDAFGSSPMDQRLVDKMTAAGVAIERFRPIVRWKFWEADHRTHRKILVIDDRIAFTGGVGIAEEWEGDARSPAEWRDTHFKMGGPIALALKSTFLTDWRDTGHPVDITDASVQRPAAVADTHIALVDGSAQIGYSDTQRVFETLVIAARQRILIQTPYFNPTPSIVGLLEDAIRRGVETDLLIPGPHIDKRVSLVMAEEMYVPLVRRGIRVWRYQPTMMHTKGVLVDGVVSMVGSLNVNRRSIQKDEEAGVAILSRPVTKELESHFRCDVSRSVPGEPTDDRSLAGRLVSKILRPIKSEL